MENKIVALMHAGNPDVDPDFDITYASHIQDVLDPLKAEDMEIVIEKSPPKTTARAAMPKRKSLKTPAHPGTEIKEAFARYEQGRLWVELFEKHRTEIWHLINHERQVTVAWQRNQGQAFMAHFVKSAQEPLYIIPQTVQKVSLQDLLIKMATVLKEKGSAALQKDIERFGLDIIEHASALASLKELFSRMAEGSLAANLQTV